MTERSIIFSGPMVRAILDGRKTQTRRVLKLNGRMPEYCGPAGCTNDPTCWGWEDHNHGDWITLEKEPGQRMGWRDWRGAYAVGDRLYVRETWAHPDITTADNMAIYRADYQEHPDICKRPSIRWRPSIHMPKWAARIWLTVTEVRVQRLQDISEEDARAEGVRGNESGQWGCEGLIEDFAELWESIHGPGAFERNDWVAAISFERAP